MCTVKYDWWLEGLKDIHFILLIHIYNKIMLMGGIKLLNVNN